jgi:hypothetical protein
MPRAGRHKRGFSISPSVRQDALTEPALKNSTPTINHSLGGVALERLPGDVVQRLAGALGLVHPACSSESMEHQRR